MRLYQALRTDCCLIIIVIGTLVSHLPYLCHMKVTIDPHSGFCFGVVYAIPMGRRGVEKDKKLYCLGDIVHNNMEVDRLRSKGLEIINHEQLKNLRDCNGTDPCPRRAT